MGLLLLNNSIRRSDSIAHSTPARPARPGPWHPATEGPLRRSSHEATPRSRARWHLMPCAAQHCLVHFGAEADLEGLAGAVG